MPDPTPHPQPEEMGRQLESSVAAIEAAIRGEKTSRLGAVGEALERQLAQVEAARRAWAAAPLAERATRRAEHEALRREAARLQWNLIVQREAMGLTRHDDVHRFYPVPAPLP